MRTRYTFAFGEAHFLCCLQMGQWVLAHDNGSRSMPILERFDSLDEAMDYARTWAKEVR